MNSFLITLSQALRDARLAALFLDSTIKSIAVLALAATLCLVWRRSSAASRHWIWFLAMASLPFLPLLSTVLPPWQKPLWSVGSSVNSANRISLNVELAPKERAGTAHHEAPWSGDPRLVADKFRDAEGRIPAGFSANWLAVVAATWFGGLTVLLIQGWAGQVILMGLSRRSRRVCGGEWPLLLEEACRDLQLRQTVTLLQSPERVMPLTWGWWRPMVLLPVDAQEWSADRKRFVLLHELAHVKRRDCLAHLVMRMICALYWFNPLVWIAARRMCVERERACDDLVLKAGCRPSEYASELVEIARMFRVNSRPAGAIALARSPQLQERVAAIVDATRRRHVSRFVLIGLTLAAAGLVSAIAAQKPDSGGKPWFDSRLRAFFTAKAQQARSLAALEKKELAPEVWPFFDAGMVGDFTTATNLYAAMRKRAYQYENTIPDARMETMVWQPVNEAFGAWEEFANWEQKYVLAYGEDIIKSIPPGSIYFGGTDPGRWVITAMTESHADGKPFFTLSQNPLADSLYEDYVRTMYGSKISVTTTNDVEAAFEEYTADAGKRFEAHQLKPGEKVTEVGGKVQVSGQVAVMAINGLIAKKIFEKNPDREFYVEESFPLDWMYPHLEPHGLIMKINRQPISGLSDGVVRQDREYWASYLKPMIGDWLRPDTAVKEVTAFAEKVYLTHDLNGFKGDPRFVASEWTQKAYSKLRSGIGGVYVWRADHAANASEKARMIREADFAFRQAYALCPYSPEAVFRYVDLLVKEKRSPDAILVAETAAKMGQRSGSASDVDQFRQLIRGLKAAK